MSDEEIEYLGSAAAKTAMQPPVTGIVLTVEPSDNGGAHRLVFNRSDGSVVPIGRRPGGEVPSAVDLHSAMFRCAVVSRKHAKIMFSDNTGHAYIIDLNSHHGTHLRKPGQLSSRMLLPELPTILSDGDIITLGKTVGRNEECVRPVVFRVELVRNPATAVASPEAPRPWLAEAAPTPTSDKASSGRFGIYVSSGSSDEMDDSEVEEVFDDDRTKAEVSVITTGATKVLDVVRNIKLPPPLGYVCGSLRGAVPYPAISPWMNLPSLKEVLQAKSRSHSPMELESPPLPPSSGIPFQDDIPALDQIIFAGEPVPEVPGVPTAEPESQQVEESSRESSQGLEESPNASDPSQLVEKLKDDISKLHAHRRKYRAKFNANVHTISVKMADYDKRITELAEKHEALDKKVADVPVPDTTALETQMNDMQEKLGFVLDVDLPDLQAQVDNIDGELCDLTEQHDEMNAAMDKTTEVTQKVQEEIQKLEGFLEELNQLRQKAREQIDQTMHEIQQTSEDAMKKIALDSARMVEALAQQPTAQPTLKRKRDADDEGDDLDAHNNKEAQPLSDISPSQPESITTNGTAATIEDNTSFVGATTPSCVSISRPRKRLRRVASVFAQTATAVTVGAIVTWSALAFT